jgi:hypothetical protein
MATLAAMKRLELFFPMLLNIDRFSEVSNEVQN